MDRTDVHPVLVEIEAWYRRAPADMDDNQKLRWIQRNADIPCPDCGEPLFVLQTPRAQNRGWYHLAMCQDPDCTFQVDD